MYWLWLWDCSILCSGCASCSSCDFLRWTDFITGMRGECRRKWGVDKNSTLETVPDPDCFVESRNKEISRYKVGKGMAESGDRWEDKGGEAAEGGGGGGRANEEVKEWIGRVTWHRWSPGLCVCVMSMVGCWSAHVENLKQKKPQCGWRRGRSRYGHNNTFRADVGKSMCVHTQAHGPGDSVSRNCHSERRLCWVPSCVPED